MNSISHILDLNIALPEIFLSLWLLIFIPLGVYSGGNKSNRQSYFSIFSIFGLLGTLLILLMGDNRAALGFYELVVTDRLATYLKSLILFSAIIVLIISEKIIKGIDIIAAAEITKVVKTIVFICFK